MTDTTNEGNKCDDGISEDRKMQLEQMRKDLDQRIRDQIDGLIKLMVEDFELDAFGHRPDFLEFCKVDPGVAEARAAMSDGLQRALRSFTQSPCGVMFALDGDSDTLQDLDSIDTVTRQFGNDPSNMNRAMLTSVLPKMAEKFSRQVLANMIMSGDADVVMAMGKIPVETIGREDDNSTPDQEQPKAEPDVDCKDYCKD
jgi:hypothetical protein